MIDSVFVDGVSIPVPTGGIYTFSSLTDNSIITAIFMPITYTIEVVAANNTSIKPSGILQYREDESVTFDIYNTNTIIVDGTEIVLVPLSIVDNENNHYTYTFSNIKANHKITTVELVTFTLTVTSSVGGMAYPAGITTYVKNSTVNMSYSPSQYYKLSAVIINGSKFDTFASGWIPIINHITKNEVWHFEFERIPILVHATSSDGGLIALKGESGVTDQTYSFYVSQQPTFVFLPNSGYKVKSVTVNGISIANYGKMYTLLPLSINTNIHVEYEQIIYRIVPGVVTNGLIDPSGEKLYVYGDTPEYTFYPNEGFVLREVTVNGIIVYTKGNTYTFLPITRNMQISAVFTPESDDDIFKITVINASPIAIITPSETMSYSRNATPTYEITLKSSVSPPISLSEVIVTVDNIPVSPVVKSSLQLTYEFPPIRKDCIIKLE